MLEVLIALIVLAFGLLGFALLQTMNLRYTQSANYRTQATNLAYDLLDLMRANRLTAVQYEAATFAAGTADTSDAACEGVMGTRNVAQQVERWQCQVARTLGEEAEADIGYDDASGVATVRIDWGESRIVEDDASWYELETQL